MNKPDTSLTSLEAAALYLSEGQTSDPDEAVHYNNQAFSIDALQKAHLRRMMGFDFSVDIKDKKMIVFSKEAPFLTEESEYSGVMDEDAVDVLVETCAALKVAWDDAKELDEEEE